VRGYPKFLNSKADYEYVKGHFPKYKWLPDFEKLIDDNKKWMKEDQLIKKEDGVIDKESKVIEEENENKEKVYCQYKFKEDPNCKINRLGMDIVEIEKLKIIAQEILSKNERR